MHLVVGSIMTSSSLARLKLSSLAFQTLIASLLIGLSVSMALAGPNPKANPADPEKVLKVAFPVPETGFDPVRVNDLYSNTITGVIFQPLLTYDWMAMPTRLVPNAAESMPVVCWRSIATTASRSPRRSPAAVRSCRWARARPS